MIYRGRLQGGVVVLDQPIDLPEGTEVTIEPVELPKPVTKTLAEQFAGIIGAAPDLPADMAEHHDHYIHGTPKS